ncbi:hypothetical protein ACWCPD_39680 [Streptomyces sp. NPDC001935]
MANPKRERALTAIANSAAAKHRRTLRRGHRVPAVQGPPLGSFDICWCGLAKGHRWPGRDEGAPHPRSTQARAGNQ